MLFADKRALERQLEVDLLDIRKKELDLYTHCSLTLSAPAALLAGFAYTGLSQIDLPEDTPREIEMLYYLSVLAAMVFEVAAVVKATLVALLGPHLALRGPPGAVTRAVTSMEPSYYAALRYFWMGLAAFHISAGLTIWMRARRDVGIVAAVFILATSLAISNDIRRTLKAFHLEKERITTGDFSPSQPATCAHALATDGGASSGSHARGHGSTVAALAGPPAMVRNNTAEGLIARLQNARLQSEQRRQQERKAKACARKPISGLLAPGGKGGGPCKSVSGGGAHAGAAGEGSTHGTSGLHGSILPTRIPGLGGRRRDALVPPPPLPSETPAKQGGHALAAACAPTGSPVASGARVLRRGGAGTPVVTAGSVACAQLVPQRHGAQLCGRVVGNEGAARSQLAPPATCAGVSSVEASASSSRGHQTRSPPGVAPRLCPPPPPGACADRSGQRLILK